MSKSYSIVDKNRKFKLEESFSLMVESNAENCVVEITSADSGIRLSEKDQATLGQPFPTESEALEALLEADLETVEDVIVQRFIRKVRNA
jgi:hypothetical protein